MYTPFKQESQVSLKITWDRNTARGFGLSLAITLLLLFFISFWHVEPIKDVKFEFENSIPMEILNFGDGDGTGLSKGNLSPEGITHKGEATTNQLEDAQVAAKTKIIKNVSSDDIETSSNLVAVNQLASQKKETGSDVGSSSRNVGDPFGLSEGTGLGTNGSGNGLGLGLGSIEWGGGGNRTVLQKRVPKYPSGVNTNVQIKIKFRVAPDGTVTSMVPMQKGDPVLERVAMDALRQWRFNPIKEQKEMWGIIPITFAVR